MILYVCLNKTQLHNYLPMKTEQRKLLLEEGGKFFIDLAKYVITGVIFTVLLTGLENQHSILYAVGGITASFFGFVGFYLLKRQED